jgi:ribosome maturation factor RimP
MGTTSPDDVRAVAAPAVASAGLVLQDVTLTPAGRRRVLRVVVDLPEDTVGGVPVDAIAQASHAVSAALDDSDVMGATPYVLEVSSPGVDRPLTERRHWRRARGRLVTAVLVDGGEVRGRLTDTTDGGIVVDGSAVGWAALRTGRIEVEFSRSADDTADDTADEDGRYSADDDRGEEG